MILIVGLGNPGERYAESRHNVGYMILERFADQRRIKINQHKFDALLGKTSIAGQEVVLLKPLTYMNLSGIAVCKAARSMKLTPEQIFVVHDDIDLPLGRIRIRMGGGSAGHNGIRSIADLMQTHDFPRIRVGVGRPQDTQEPADYVLEPFPENERELLSKVVELSTEAISSIILNGLEQTMNSYNRKNLLEVNE